ncbi:MAG: Gfo/Idh/MocA family oxidoreductase [Verrucomicrobiota bacterium]
MNGRVRIGIVGAGGNTKAKHIPGFQAIDGVSVDLVCNRSEASSRKVADEFDIPRIAEKWEAVVADPEIDAICIGTWPYLHAPIAIAALKAGKHVLTEARIAMNASEATAMLKASQEHPKLVAQVVPSPFTLRWDRTIQKLLSSGELGDLREARFIKSLAANVDSQAEMSWRQNVEYSGNNTLMFGIYYEPLQRWLGKEPKRVLAKGSIFTLERRNAESGSMESVCIPETVTVIAEYENGMQLIGVMSGLEQGASNDEYVICGSKGSLRLDLNASRLTLSKLGEPDHRIEPLIEDE